MVIRIRFGAGPKVAKGRRKNRRAAQVLAAALTPLAAMALALGCWRIAADLGWTSSFVIPSGLFSHWQVWLGAAAVTQLCSRILNRYGKDGDAQAS
jgi:ABC-type nitrate/sulfonate/bicarbonate transport system permease component